MNLNVIGSGSDGNCYVLEDRAGKCLILEAGVRWNKVKKAVGYKPSNVAGLLATHSHGDHFEFAEQFINAGITVFCTEGTAIDGGIEQGRYEKVVHGEWMTIKGTDYSYQAFDVQHDANQPVNYMIHHPEMGLLIFVTDTNNVNVLEGEADHWLIEANYEYEWLMQSERPNKERVIAGHMSIETCISTLKRMNAENSCTVTLCHLSSENSQHEIFADRVEKEVGIRPFVAKKGLEVCL